MIFTDCQAAMQRILSDAPGPGQGQATLAIRLAETICQRGSTADVRWVSGHRGVEGNELADQRTRGAAEEETSPDASTAEGPLKHPQRAPGHESERASERRLRDQQLVSISWPAAT